MDSTSTGATSSSTMAGRLVTSDDSLTSAIELCGSKTSLGPDHLSFYGKTFCDMETKKLLPLCEGPDDVACFDTQSNRMRPGPKQRRRDQLEGTKVPVKSYHIVKNWN